MRPESRLLRALAVLALLPALALGCGSGGDEAADTAAETPTRAQRDSAIAESGLPGSGAVGTALDAAAAAADRAEAHDTIN